MTTYRTVVSEDIGRWGVTIVREGPGPEDVMGHHSGDQLVAVVVNGDRELAARICALLNGEGKPALLPNPPVMTQQEFEEVRTALQRAIAADSCTCSTGTAAGTAPDPFCPVHRGRRARGPKPPPVGPGCICDGSGRTCPRHGVVL